MWRPPPCQCVSNPGKEVRVNLVKITLTLSSKIRFRAHPGRSESLCRFLIAALAPIHDICSRIAKDHKGYNLTAATRAFILSYFRAAATEEGHSAAGHGQHPDHRAKAGPGTKVTPRIALRPQSEPATRRLIGR